MWVVDSKLDNIALDTESLKIPLLHGKYLAILSKVRLQRNVLNIKKQQLRTVLSNYYRGNLNHIEDLKEIGRGPQQVRILKQDIPIYIEGDDEYVEMGVKIAYHNEMVTTLEEILKSLNFRSMTIGNAIKWRQLTQFGDA